MYSLGIYSLLLTVLLCGISSARDSVLQNLVDKQKLQGTRDARTSEEDDKDATDDIANMLGNLGDVDMTNLHFKILDESESIEDIIKKRLEDATEQNAEEEKKKKKKAEPELLSPPANEKPVKQARKQQKQAGYGPDKGKYNRPEAEGSTRVVEMNKQEIIDYLEGELTMKDRLVEEFRNVDNKCAQYAELSGETVAEFGRLETEISNKDGTIKQLQQEVDKLNKQVRNFELDREQWQRDEQGFHNELSRLVLDLKVAGDVIKDQKKEMKQSNARTDAVKEELKQVRALAELSGNNPDLSAELIQCKTSAEELRETQKTLTESLGQKKKQLHECTKSSAERKKELDSTKKKAAKYSTVKKQLKECEERTESPQCPNFNRVCPELEREAVECKKEMDKLKAAGGVGNTVCGEHEEAYYKKQLQEASMQIDKYEKMGKECQFQRTACLQSEHYLKQSEQKLKQQVFKIEKAHNDTLRMNDLLNGTISELNDKLDDCSKLVTEATEDLQAYKNGDPDDEKCLKSMATFYEISHSLDRCAMANDYLNLKIIQQDKWKAEADTEILALAEMGGCEPQLQLDHVQCKKANKDMQESHDHLAQNLAQKTKELSDTQKEITELKKEVKSSSKGKCTSVKKQLRECKESSDSTQVKLQSAEEELKKTKEKLQKENTASDSTCQENLKDAADRYTACKRMKQGFKVARHFVKKELAECRQNSSMLYDRLQTVIKDEQACQLAAQKSQPAYKKLEEKLQKTKAELSSTQKELDTTSELLVDVRLRLEENIEVLQNRAKHIDLSDGMTLEECTETFQDTVTRLVQCVKHKQGFKVARYFVKKDLEQCRQNATMLHERLQVVIKEQDQLTSKQQTNEQLTNDQPADKQHSVDEARNGACASALESALSDSTNCQLTLDNVRDKHNKLNDDHAQLQSVHGKRETQCKTCLQNLTDCKKQKEQAEFVKSSLDMIVKEQEESKALEKEKYDMMARRAKRVDVYLRVYFYPLLAAFVLLLTYNVYGCARWRWNVYQQRVQEDKQQAKTAKLALRTNKGKKLKTK